MVTVRRNTSEISMKTNHRSIENAIDATCIYIIYCNMLYILYIFALLYKLYIFVLFSLCDSTIRTQINAPTSRVFRSKRGVSDLHQLALPIEVEAFGQCLIDPGERFLDRSILPESMESQASSSFWLFI